jgi:hypothetical protein
VVFTATTLRDVYNERDAGIQKIPASSCNRRKTEVKAGRVLEI